MIVQPACTRLRGSSTRLAFPLEGFIRKPEVTLVPDHGYATLAPNKVATSLVQRLGLPTSHLPGVLAPRKAPICCMFWSQLAIARAVGAYTTGLSTCSRTQGVARWRVPKFEIMQIHVLDRKLKPAMDRVSHGDVGQGIVGDINGRRAGAEMPAELSAAKIHWTAPIGPKCSGRHL